MSILDSINVREIITATFYLSDDERNELGRAKALELIDGYDILIANNNGIAPQDNKKIAKNLSQVVNIMNAKGGNFENQFPIALKSEKLDLIIDWMAAKFREDKKNHVGGKREYSDAFLTAELAIISTCALHISVATEELQQKFSKHFHPRAFQETRLRITNILDQELIGLEEVLHSLEH